jgi:CTP-dependent riboflavin kinase
LKTVILQGKVSSGQGGGTRFLSLPWVQKQIIEKLGFKPFPGTLNLRLTEKSVKTKKELIETGKAIVIVPVKDFCCGFCYKARIMDKVDGAVIMPQVPDYPEELLEIIAPVSLRKTLRLREGDEVRLSVYLPA